MKKILLVLLAGLLPFFLLACGQTTTTTTDNLLSGSTTSNTATSTGEEQILYVLNWGEYINEDLVAEFTAETGIVVEITTVDSNEAMETRLKTGTATFDIVIPSDYMIEKLYDEGYLQKIDLTKLTHFSQTNFLTGVNDIMDQLFVDNTDTVDSSYEVCMPYFWGLFGIMYNTGLEGIGAYLETNGWASVFGPEPAGLSRSLDVGIYSVPRFAYSAALIYAAQNDTLYPALADNAFNVFSQDNIDLAETILGQRDYTEWATDMLKKNVDANELDLAFTYVGDYFDTYLINAEAAGATTGAEAEDANAHIGIYIPDYTMAFVDAMVIPTAAEHVDNAHLFIDFFIDPENAYLNSDIVGYSTTLAATYDMILNATQGDLVRQTMVQNHPYDPMTVEGVAFAPLIAFSNDDTSEIDSMLIRVRN